MKFNLPRQLLLNSLLCVTGVIENRQSMPILSHVLIRVENNHLFLIGSDLGIELKMACLVDSDTPLIETTVSARKLMDICKALPESCDIMIEIGENKILILSGKSRFSLMTLPSVNFPLAEINKETHQVLIITQTNLLKLLESTAFSMGHKDVRYYLNGLSLFVDQKDCSAIATDGHRLALCQVTLEQALEPVQFILPRKTVTELLRLLPKKQEQDKNNDQDKILTLKIKANAIHLESDSLSLVSRLIEGVAPDYRRSLSAPGDKRVEIDRDYLKQALQRAAVLVNEKYQAVSLLFNENKLVITAVNAEQEEAIEELEVVYNNESLECNMNIHYLLDVLSIVPAGKVVLTLSTPDESVLIQSKQDGSSQFIIMPLSL